MKKIFSVLLSLALVVSLGVLTVAPVMAAAPVLPSISPETADYDLDDPGHIAIGLDLGDADDLDSIEDNSGPLAADNPNGYYQFENLVVITEAYLDSVLDCIGDTVLLQVNFKDDGGNPFGVAFLTVTAIGTAPGLQESSADWNYWTGGDVIVGIDWGIATDVDDVSDDVGSLNEGVDWVHTLTTLNITDAYLTGKLLNLGDSVELTVEFDSCDYGVPPQSHTATLTITAVGTTKPSIAPTTAVYDKCIEPGGNNDIPFTITWDGATAGSGITKIENITDYQNPSDLIFGFAYTVVGTTLTIKDAYLDILNGLGLTSTVLRVTFDDPAITQVILYISLEWLDQPTLGLTGTAYTWDINTQASSYGPLALTLVNLGCASNITRIYDDEGYNLTGSPGAGKCFVTYDYIITYDPGYGFLIATTNCYIIPTLTFCGDDVVLTVEFDKGADATYSITATGIEPSLDPTSAEFNLDAPANVTTTVDLGNANNFTITGLTEGVDYTVSGDTVTIMADYLSTVLTEVESVAALEFDFDVCGDAIFTITAVGTPLCFIATAAYGSPAAEEINIIREFRDVVLRPNKLGAELVSLYYEASPPIAEFISQNEALRTAVRVGFIDPIVAILNWSHGLWS